MNLKIPKLNILVVDDSKNLRTITKRYLSSSKLFIPTFFEANHGEEALMIVQEQHIEENHIDLIMLDWMMPKMQGAEFLQHLRAVETFATNPLVIMLTAETYSEQMNAVVKYKVKEYITKPFSQESLCSGVEKLIDELIEIQEKRSQLLSQVEPLNQKKRA